MYRDYFGFKENPFSIAPNPRYLYMSGPHQEALAHLIYGAASDGCITLLTGDVGTGKTTICRRFLEQLPANTNVAVVINPKLSSEELLATICDEFQISTNSSSATVKDHIDNINRFLLDGHARGNQAVVVIDEAQNLAPDVLETVRLLTNLETDSRKLLKIFLLGQPELADILRQPGQAQINQRITGRYHLRGLRKEDIDDYLAQRIRIAGGGRSRLFTAGARRLIFRQSGGIPRVINNLCDHALLGAYSGNKDCVDRKIVRQAAREIFGQTTHNRKKSYGVYVTIAMGLLLIIASGIWFKYYHQEATSVPDVKSQRLLSTAEPLSTEKAPEQLDKAESQNREQKD